MFFYIYYLFLNIWWWGFCIFKAQEESSCTNYIYYLTHKFPNDQRNLKKDEQIGKEFSREKDFCLWNFWN